ncbi:MAG: cytochrome oxidase [Pseudomonadota bacterium]
MQLKNEQANLVKFLVMSGVAFFVGAVHGMLQVIPSVRAWLDSIGSPYGGPGHMIDPLAHAHLNLIGGVVLLLMGVTFYLLPILSGKPIYSWRLVNHTFWWTSIGVFYFYSTLMVFGIWEGTLLLNNSPDITRIHHYYGPIIAFSGVVMTVGFGTYLANIILSLRNKA